MEINLDEKRLTTDRSTWELVDFLQHSETSLGLERAQLYYEFPILKDVDDNVVIAKVLLLSPNHGIVVISTLSMTSLSDPTIELRDADDELEHVFSLIYSRIIRNKLLRRSKTELLCPTNTVIFAPNLGQPPVGLHLEAALAVSLKQIGEVLQAFQASPLRSSDYDELVATLEGAKGIIRPKPRVTDRLGPRSKGVLANDIESEISSFDRRQKQGAMAVLDGLQRIRGLAGSGKTVVLTMKAALTHLRNPDATILYTFYTKSLYQHIQRLITRFYRQFDDKDPDWSRLRIMHAWGGYTSEGVYFNACIASNLSPVTLSEARANSARDPFDYACKKLLADASVVPAYNYVLVDEGQDFPASFLKLCLKLSEKSRVVFAYDDLQTIFQASTPRLQDIVGVDNNGNPLVELTEDVILYKCYRNPREILVCAHALGFGIYGNTVQMLENREQWEDIGYNVVKGDFVAGSSTEIERPAVNSLATISMNQSPGEIVNACVYDTFDEEVDGTIRSIAEDLKEGLRPDDILVIVVDDRNARSYLRSVSVGLTKIGVPYNNIHDDTYGIRDFYREGHVTLSTVHKAKGNEAFMVYVLGVDALYSTYAGVRERNVLFTAMTRAKGWVRVSGVGKSAAACEQEIDTALRNFPYLKFKYPDKEQLKIIRRDLAARAIRKQAAERKLDEVLDEMGADEIRSFLEQRAIKKSGR